jgi:predicted AAA+ superfamily ATPase
MPSDVPRLVHDLAREALGDTRVVGLVGPRQAGKSTLAQQIVAETPHAEYVTLDDRETRSAAMADPAGFVEARPGMLAIDEIQRVPDLLLALKSTVDRDKRPGRFLVTGSSQLSANRGVSETLTGRIERLTLWPFSQDELAGRRSSFLDSLFTGRPPSGFECARTKRDYLMRATSGGFPEAIRRTERRRDAWFSAYIETVIEREAPGVSASPRTADLPRLLRLVAARHAGILNTADLAADAQLPRTSVLRYLDTLEALFLTVRLPAWSPNLSQREIRAPKILVTDSGLAAHLRQADVETLVRPELAAGADGPIIEGFVTTEIMRQAVWSDLRPRLSHYRDRDGTEVDLIIEARGLVVAVEIKAGSGGDASAARHLGRLRDRLGDRFANGIVLHTGSRSNRLGDRVHSFPIAALWE